ncbi:AAA family ATPase [Crocosphaera sp. XPORK-15E]|uniref:AAA family ATPase n=1 Tax=Crocosphaera sp. XPORK-15E TaxID=3110247 RepID=UPI002B206601|nr:AAA family ATPase [Crocosphaera sp. XPORK-15E]MEA5534945.1 AAA family ATPase [Crocosphaera sp. XPORK-15E]
MQFHPRSCRNEREVESKLIVQYLLPQLGYSPDNWHQEVCFGNIRLDFLTVAVKKIKNFSSCVVIEAKHPQENLDHHVRRLGHYLIKTKSLYGVLTNGKEFRIYQRETDKLKLVFCCSGETIESNITRINALIGKESLQSKSISPKSLTTQEFSQNSVNVPQVSKLPTTESKKTSMKVITVYHNKGGVGKTTTVVNLAAALSKKGKRVLVIDLDSQANTTFATGLVKFDDEEFDNIKDCNILHVLRSEDFYSIEEVAIKSQFTNPEIHVIPSHIDLMQCETEFTQIENSRFRLLNKLEKAKDIYDIVIIDTPPSLNLYARIALITSDYLIIPSDLKPFANQGLINVKEFIKQIDGFRRQISRESIEILGILACKISTNAKFVEFNLRKRLAIIPKRYEIPMMETVIYDRDDLAKCAEKMQLIGDIEIPDPVSILDFKPDSKAAQEFELLAMEVLEKIGEKQ